MMIQSRCAIEVMRPVSARSFRQASWQASRMGGVVREHTVGEISLAQILPDVLRCVKFGACWWQRDKGEIAGWVELARGVPAGLIENEQRMRRWRDGAADRLEMRLHGLGVCLRHDEGNAGVAARADGAESIGVLVALIFGLAWTPSFPGPLIDETVVPAAPHFVPDPHFDRRPRGERAYNLRDLRRNVFLKAAIASGFWTGCCGRALMCAKPSFFRTRPKLTSDRSTPKRCPRTRFRSMQRQRTTPSVAGSGPVSDQLLEHFFLLLGEFLRPPGRLDVDQSLWTVLVKAVHPVSQRLPVHAADPRRLGAVHPVMNRRQRQQPTGLRAVFGLCCKAP